MDTDTLQPLINKRFRLMQLLGAGGMGQVYRALDGETGQVVALKRVQVLDAIRGRNRQSTAEDNYCALAREFQLLVSLNHPHIVNVIDFGFDEGDQPFYTMEFLHNAQPIVAHGHDMSLQEKKELLGQMFSAIAHLHQKGILHRDLKPENVMVVDGQVKLLDFGLSAGLTNAGYGLQGTVAYMAPELLKGRPPSIATDLYAGGVIAYELLAGQHPYDARNVNKLMLSILHEDPDLTALPDDAPLREFIGRLLARDEAERPASAENVIDMLTAGMIRLSQN